MSTILDLTFEVIKQKVTAQNSAGCNTAGRSTCCSTYCTAKACQSIDTEAEATMNAWDNYLQINTGVLQY